MRNPVSDRLELHSFPLFQQLLELVHRVFVHVAEEPGPVVLPEISPLRILRCLESEHHLVLVVFARHRIVLVDNENPPAVVCGSYVAVHVVAGFIGFNPLNLNVSWIAHLMSHTVSFSPVLWLMKT